MTNQLVSTPSTPDLTPSFAGTGARASQSRQLAHAAEGYRSLPLLFQELTQSLAVLSGTAELVLKGKAAGESMQGLRISLHPNARQAELSMHKLRDLRLTKSAALTDLSQSLT